MRRKVSALKIQDLKILASLAPLLLAVGYGVAGFDRAAAQDRYPTHPITMIVPFPAGGGVDALARIVADKLGAGLGQPVIIDNRGGAGGVIGTRLGAKAAPDGYTLIISDSGTTSINPALYAAPGYDPTKDFIPVGLIATTPIVLMAHPALPARSVADLIALAKSEAGRLNFGTPPPGTLSYLSAELFKAAAGVDMTIVPYKGTAALTSDLLGGHVRVGFNVLAPALGSIQSGALRLIATAGPKRTSLFPEVPTVIEQGLAGFEAELHYGLLVPTGTPQEIVARVNRELRVLVNSPDVRARIAADGGDARGSTPEEYADDIDRESAKWSALIRRLNLRVD
jgi:tripartite-type tricarboxylate transporter receptor subunit TctC